MQEIQDMLRKRCDANGEKFGQLKRMRVLLSSVFVVVVSTFASANAAAQEMVPVAPPARPAPAPAAPAALPPSASPAPQSPTIQLNSPEPMSLETRDTPDGRWRGVCSTPCNMRLPTTAEYRLTGGGLRASRPFRIDPMQRDTIELRVDPSSKGWFAGGIVLVAVGGVAMVGGGIVALTSGHSTRNIVGTVVCLAGIGVAAGGVVIMAKNGSTKVYDGEQRLIIRTTKREPEWNMAMAQDVAAPAVWNVPVLSGSF